MKKNPKLVNQDYTSNLISFPVVHVEYSKPANESAIKASADIQRKVKELVKLQQKEKLLLQEIKEFIGKHEVLESANGNVLCTYKTVIGSLTLDSKRLKEELPDVYGKFVKKTADSRRLVIK